MKPTRLWVQPLVDLNLNATLQCIIDPEQNFSRQSNFGAQLILFGKILQFIAAGEILTFMYLLLIIKVIKLEIFKIRAIIIFGDIDIETFHF